MAEAGKPVVAASMGDPGGVGPEILLRILPRAAAANLLIFGEARYLERAAEAAGLSPLARGGAPADAATAGHALIETPSDGEAPLGAPSAAGGAASLRYVESALAAVQAGGCQALVTMPVSKLAWEMAGARFAGHTELLAERTGAFAVMLLSGGGLRIALASTHLPLADVPARLERGLLARVFAVTFEALKRDFGVASPRLGVMGLNPHASDGGRFGDEEERLIRPAIEAASAAGMAISGPLPPDAAPRQMLDGKFDALVAMYHEQATLPVKTLAFHQGVNVTLGLPIVRTSPDHGTAYDIAGQGTARPDSTLAAIETAVAIANYRKAAT